MTAVDNQKIILRLWGPNHHFRSNESLYIRVIHPDGCFFGEVHHGLVRGRHGGYIYDVEGKLPSQTNNEIRTLIAEIVDQHDAQTRLDHDVADGLLAVGELSSPDIVLKYSPARQSGTDIPPKFEQIIELLRPYCGEPPEYRERFREYRGELPETSEE